MITHALHQHTVLPRYHPRRAALTTTRQPPQVVDVQPEDTKKVNSNFKSRCSRSRGLPFPGPHSRLLSRVGDAPTVPLHGRHDPRSILDRLAFRSAAARPGSPLHMFDHLVSNLHGTPEVVSDGNPDCYHTSKLGHGPGDARGQLGSKGCGGVFS